MTFDPESPITQKEHQTKSEDMDSGSTSSNWHDTLGKVISRAVWVLVYS